jgi:DNA-directed RNA polymerase specialized sigma24 family protein
MTREEYGREYKDGYPRTVNLLLSRGVSEDSAREAAQAAWARGWERRDQLRDQEKALVWVNSIAMNYFRSRLRQETSSQKLPELSTLPQITPVAIDIHRMLKRCKIGEQQLLTMRYLLGWEICEIAKQHGWSETAVRIRLMRARRNLRRFFEARPVGVRSHASETSIQTYTCRPQ